MKHLDLILFKETSNAAFHFVALQDYNLVFEGPLKVPTVNDFLEQLDRFEKCLVDGAARPDTKKLTEFGQSLAAALFPGGIKQLASMKANDALRLGICSTDPILKRVPWEYLVWPNERTAPSASCTIARLVPITNGSETPAVTLDGRPLRVCMIVADPPDLARVPWDELQQSLNQTFKGYLDQKGIAAKVELDLVEGATRTSVNQALDAKEYDVVHFLGHGDSNGLFMVNRSTGKSQHVPTDAVVDLFGRPTVQLVILSACETGKLGAGALSTVAEELVAVSLPAVIGSQFVVPANVIAIFCASLYQNLLRHGDVDDAVAAGRRAIKVELSNSGGGAPIEWGIPILYRRPGRSKLFA